MMWIGDGVQSPLNASGSKMAGAFGDIGRHRFGSRRQWGYGVCFGPSAEVSPIGTVAAKSVLGLGCADELADLFR